METRQASEVRQFGSGTSVEFDADTLGRGGARERWSRQIAAWQQSGLSQAAYCRQAGLRPTDFSVWKKKLGCSGALPSGFVTVSLATREQVTARGAALAVELPGGYRIAVSPDFDELTLQRLIAVLR